MDFQKSGECPLIVFFTCKHRHDRNFYVMRKGFFDLILIGDVLHCLLLIEEWLVLSNSPNGDATGRDHRRASRGMGIEPI